MPRVKRRAKRRRDYTDSEIKTLTSGVAMTTGWGLLRKGTANLATMEAAWKDLRDDVLPAWIAENPLTRPMGWLLFDAKEPRIRVAGEAKIEAAEHTKQFGESYRIHYFRGLNRRLGVAYTASDESDLESESQYLRRIGELTEAELQLL